MNEILLFALTMPPDAKISVESDGEGAWVVSMSYGQVSERAPLRNPAQLVSTLETMSAELFADLW